MSVDTASSQTPRFGFPLYTTADYNDNADIPRVLNEVTQATDEILGDAVDQVGVQASAVAASETSSAFLLMGA
jgi:hypothetical protein